MLPNERWGVPKNYLRIVFDIALKDKRGATSDENII